VIGTPLTGVIFSVEGANGKFPPYIILSGVVGGFFANLIGLTLCFLFNMDFKLLDLTTNISFPILIICIFLLL
jgi:hypothetical protein